MLNETRTVYFDPDLKIEAYRFKGIMQKFPAHFHEYYVIGFIEEGQRKLICQGKEFVINPGDILIFNPYDTHSCEQIDGKTLDYRCINVKTEVIKKAVFEIKGDENIPRFKENVLYQSEMVSTLTDFRKKSPILKECEGYNPVSKWEMNFGWRLAKPMIQ